VPGCEPWLIASKRYLMPAPAGTGKSLAAIVIAVEVVASGGTVAILDVENGSEEYATRLDYVLGDRRELALLFKTIATLRTDAPLFSDVDELRWEGPADAFGSLPAGIVDDALAGRVAALVT
jgi:hypothetical protein